MSRIPARPQQLRGKVFRGGDAVTRGWLTRKQLRSSAWHRLRRDVYADAALPLTHRLLVSAVGLTFPAGAGFTGRSALVLWGADVADVADPVEVVLPVGRRWNAGPGVRVQQSRPGQELVRRGRWLCALPEEAAVEVVRRLSTDDGVVLVDRLVRSGVTSLAAVRDAAVRLPACRGSARAREVVGLADGLAESPQESRLRLTLLRAGLPAPVAQHRVFDDGGFVARVDFAYVELKIAIEYDGLWHGERTAFLADRRRLNRLTAAGWVVVHVTAEDLRSPERLVARIAAARARRTAQARTR